MRFRLQVQSGGTHSATFLDQFPGSWHMRIHVAHYEKTFPGDPGFSAYIDLHNLQEFQEFVDELDYPVLFGGWEINLQNGVYHD